jgi:hypothetical protein
LADSRIRKFAFLFIGRSGSVPLVCRDYLLAKSWIDHKKLFRM